MSSSPKPTGKSLITEFAPDRLEHFYILGKELEVPEGWTGQLDAGAIGYRFLLTRIDKRELRLAPELRKQERITFYNTDGVEVARVEKDTGWVAGGMPVNTPANIRGESGRLLP